MIATPIKRFAAPLLLAAGLAACFPYDSPQAQRTPTSAQTLAGAWRVIELDGEPVRGNLVLSRDEFRLSFCNDLAGGLRIEDQRIVPLPPMRQTERGCINSDGSTARSVAWDERAARIFARPLPYAFSNTVVILANEQGSLTLAR